MEEPPSDNASLAFEREKWDASQRRLDQEFALKERELTLKEAEVRRARLWNPLAIAILGGSIAAAGSAFVSLENNQTNLEVEKFKAESARILEVVKTGNPDVAAKNLSFLLETGLIQNPSTVDNVSRYLRGRKEGEGISLPPPAPSISALQRQLDQELHGGGARGPVGYGARALMLQDEINKQLGLMRPQP